MNNRAMLGGCFHLTDGFLRLEPTYSSQGVVDQWLRNEYSYRVGCEMAAKGLKS